jgi:prevent-host-death family protein
MSEIINIQEAKTHLSRYVEDAAAGKELILGKAGKPMARLIPYRAPSKPRKLGLLAGKIQEADDAWSSETDAALEAELNGEDAAEDRPSLRVAEEPS